MKLAGLLCTLIFISVTIQSCHCWWWKFWHKKEFTVKYQIEYPDGACSSNPDLDPVNVKVKRGSTVLDVMEQAVDDFGMEYEFSATYFADDRGYSIDSINGVATDVASGCIWTLVIADSDGEEMLQSVDSVEDVCIYASDTCVIWRYVQVEEVTVETEVNGEATAATTQTSTTMEIN